MLAVISPAKTLDFESPTATDKSSKAALLDDAEELVGIMRGYGPRDLVDLMGISEKLGVLNADRYIGWERPTKKNNARQAILAFRGDVYTGLDADTFKDKDFEYAQEHLRILSGLYGILRPLDLIQPYRLEMGTKLANKRGGNLYDFWGDKLAKSLNKQLKKAGSETIVNLASNEYWNAVDKSALKADIVTPVFKDYKNGKYKIVSFYAKKARGLMSAYIVRNRVTTLAQLKKFKSEGYCYSAAESSASELVFLRDSVG